MTTDIPILRRNAGGPNSQKNYFFETESKPVDRKKVSNINIYGLSFKNKKILDSWLQFSLKVMRTGGMITKDELSWCLNKFSQLVLSEMYGDQ